MGKKKVKVRKKKVKVPWRTAVLKLRVKETQVEGLRTVNVS